MRKRLKPEMDRSGLELLIDNLFPKWKLNQKQKIKSAVGFILQSSISAHRTPTGGRLEKPSSRRTTLLDTHADGRCIQDRQVISSLISEKQV